MSREDIYRANAAATAALTPEQELIAASVSEMSEYNNDIPSAATSWSRPGEDWKRTCRCDLSSSEVYASHVCHTTPNPLGDRAVALTRVAKAMQRGSEADWRDEAEAVDVASRHEEFGLAAHPLAPTGPSAFSPRDEVDRYATMLAELGITAPDSPHSGRPRVTNHHGKPGSGQPVTSATRAHAEALRGHDEQQPGGPDASQPRRGGRTYPGVIGGIGTNPLTRTANDVVRDHPDFFKVPAGRGPYRAPRGRSQRGYGSNT